MGGNLQPGRWADVGLAGGAVASRHGALAAVSGYNGYHGRLTLRQVVGLIEGLWVVKSHLAVAPGKL
eukprot:1152193-Pelagomonas_calceolata.AAC.2